jgi:hypothetical protein
MSKEKHELTEEELAAQAGEPLPDREVMSMVNPLPQPMPFAEGGGGATPQPDGGPTYIDPQPSSDGQPTATDQKPQMEPEPVPIANDEPQDVPPYADPAERGPESA